MEIITQNETHLVTIEKLQNKWWLELIERASGMNQILICNTKAIAKACFKDMAMSEIIEMMGKIAPEKHKTYKENAFKLEVK